MDALQNECSLPESIRCYLLRGNAMVPLIPADQLPFQLKGIPRLLSHRQMSDEGWKLFKETKEAPFLLSIQAASTNDSPSHCSPGRPQYLAPDHHVRNESQTTQTALNSAIQTSLVAMDNAPKSPDTPSVRAVERPSPLTDAVTAVCPSDVLRLGYTSVAGGGVPKKVYCTHWIATGECRWTLTGCKYKHEMPGTEKLRELGFTRGTPKWWKDKNAVSPPKSLTWMQRRVLKIGDEELQIAEIPPPRAFPDPSTLRTRKLEDRSDDLSNETQKNQAIPGEECPMASKPSLPVSPSIRTPPVSSLPQTPNLIDLEDIGMIFDGPQSAHFPSTESSEKSSTPAPRSETSIIYPSSSPLRPSHPTPASNRKTKTANPHRTRKPLSLLHSSPSPPSSSSSSSSVPEESSNTDTDTDTDTDDPHTRTRTRKLSHRRKMPSHRKNVSSMNAATRTSPRLARSLKKAQQPQLGLASSKHAVQTVASSAAGLRQDKDAQAGQSVKKVHRKERRGEKTG